MLYQKSLLQIYHKSLKKEEYLSLKNDKKE